MKSLRAGLLAAAIAIFAFPSAATAEEVVPPGNSAVNQYTETFPTTGGDREAEHGKKGRAAPAKVIGEKNTKKLERHGREGEEVATVAAATAPSTITPVAEEDAGDNAATPGGKDHRGGNAPPRKADAPQQAVASVPANTSDGPSGSSGLGEVLAQATGTSSSGELGLLLPLAIIAAVFWAVATRRRTRKPAQ